MYQRLMDSEAKEDSEEGVLMGWNANELRLIERFKRKSTWNEREV